MASQSPPRAVKVHSMGWGKLDYVCTSWPTCTILTSLWGSDPPQSMQRTIARLLLLLAVAGNLIPLALAATAVPPHACCIRASHHCHNSAISNSQQPEFRSTCCCRQGCGHAVTTAQWADPKTPTAPVGTPVVNSRVTPWHSAALLGEVLTRQSTRAPPSFLSI
jgi:hypothetical protein